MGAGLGVEFGVGFFGEVDRVVFVELGFVEGLAVLFEECVGVFVLGGVKVDGLDIGGAGACEDGVLGGLVDVEFVDAGFECCPVFALCFAEGVEVSGALIFGELIDFAQDACDEGVAVACA